MIAKTPTNIPNLFNILPTKNPPRNLLTNLRGTYNSRAQKHIIINQRFETSKFQNYALNSHLCIHSKNAHQQLQFGKSYQKNIPL